MAATVNPDRYNAMKARAGQQALVEKQQSGDAMTRRFARMNNLNSGAYAASSGKADQDIEDRKARNIENVEFQQQGAQEALDESERGRAFQTSERLGSQDFGAAQADKQRGWQTGERLGSQGFAADEAARGREFTGKLNEKQMAQQASQFESSQKQQADQFGYSLGEQRAARQQQADQFGANIENNKQQFRDTMGYNSYWAGQGQINWQNQFDEDKRVTDFNMEMAKHAGDGNSWTDMKDGLGSIFGSGGSSGSKVTNSNANVITFGGWNKFNNSTGGKYQAFNDPDPRAMPDFVKGGRATDAGRTQGSYTGGVQGLNRSRGMFR